MGRLFGTDGVRGVANDELTPLLAMQLGQAGAYVLTKENMHKPTIMVGCDTRISGDMLANALMAGICSVGANAVYVGVIPTPAVAYLTRKYKVDAGVVISASHNPVEFNGIKFFDGNGYKLPDALEDEIENIIRNDMNGIKFPIGANVGKIKYRTDAREEYINHSIQAVNVDLSKLKIVVDCAEGASYYTSVEALKELGANIVAIHNMPDGTNINANCGSTHMEELKARVVYEKADIGLAFDGDADRLMAVDEKGYIYLRASGMKEDSLLMVLDKEGNLVSQIRSKEYTTHMAGCLGVGKDGEVYTLIMDKDNMLGIASVDVENQCLKKIYSGIVPEGTLMLDLIAPGADTDFVLWGYDGIFTYNLGEKSAVNILPAWEAPCDYEGVLVLVLPDGRIVFADRTEFRVEKNENGQEEIFSIPDKICFYYKSG